MSVPSGSGALFSTYFILYMYLDIPSLSIYSHLCEYMNMYVYTCTCTHTYMHILIFIFNPYSFFEIFILVHFIFRKNISCYLLKIDCLDNRFSDCININISLTTQYIVVMCKIWRRQYFLLVVCRCFLKL